MTALKTTTRLRTLLWLDCTAAGVVGVAMLALSGALAPLFGLPRALLVYTALANLAYGAFSFSLTLGAAMPRRRAHVLVVANFIWSAVCVYLAARYLPTAHRLGVAYLVVEGIFVAVLAVAETAAVRSVSRC